MQDTAVSTDCKSPPKTKGLTLSPDPQSTCNSAEEKSEQQLDRGTHKRARSPASVVTKEEGPAIPQTPSDASDKVEMQMVAKGEGSPDNESTIETGLNLSPDPQDTCNSGEEKSEQQLDRGTHKHSCSPASVVTKEEGSAIPQTPSDASDEVEVQMVSKGEGSPDNKSTIETVVKQDHNSSSVQGDAQEVLSAPCSKDTGPVIEPCLLCNGPKAKDSWWVHLSQSQAKLKLACEEIDHLKRQLKKEENKVQSLDKRLRLLEQQMRFESKPPYQCQAQPDQKDFASTSTRQKSFPETAQTRRSKFPSRTLGSVQKKRRGVGEQKPSAKPAGPESTHTAWPDQKDSASTSTRQKKVKGEGEPKLIANPTIPESAHTETKVPEACPEKVLMTARGRTSKRPAKFADGYNVDWGGSTEEPTYKKSTLKREDCLVAARSTFPNQRYIIEGVPFPGWQRELVYRNTVDPTGRVKGVDIYFHSPEGGKKLRSRPDVVRYFEERGHNGLDLVAHFDFRHLWCVCQNKELESEGDVIQCSFGGGGCNGYVHAKCVGLEHLESSECAEMKDFCCALCEKFKKEVLPTLPDFLQSHPVSSGNCLVEGPSSVTNELAMSGSLCV